jgi:HTH-type transcriptional regulator/antitoxin HigA
MTTRLLAARPVAPGRILRRELEERGWTQKDLAGITGRPEQTIAEIVQGKKAITPQTAIALAEAFGTSADFWVRLESSYKLAVARRMHAEQAPGDVARRARLYSLLPIRELVKRRWIAFTDSVDELERGVRELLGVRSLDETPELAACLRGPASVFERSAHVAWLKRVERVAAHQRVRRFDQKRYAGLVQGLLQLADTDASVPRVPSVLNDYGIRFVIVPHLQGTKLDGAAVSVKGRPIIALSMRYDRIDWFWFTLLHELAHLVLGHTGRHVDSALDQGTQTSRDERQANERAGTWLVGDEDLKRLAQSARGAVSKAAVQALAREHRRHPGIIVGRMHYLGLLPYTHLRQFLVKVRARLAPWIDGGGPPDSALPSYAHTVSR